MNCVIGFDTSCYTTSAAIMDLKGKLVADARMLLAVKPGARGLSQSEMVFQHTRNLPAVFEAALLQAGTDIVPIAVGATSRPRPLPESYMPAFLVGEGYAKVLAASHQIKLFRISHQENHILAGLWSAGGPQSDRFLAAHVSGGTTEIVEVARCAKAMQVTLLGGSIDLHAGQFIDRIGVALGLPFPAGRHMETLAQQSTGKLSIPVSVKGMSVSFSGPETHVMRLLDKGCSPGEIADAVQRCIAESLNKLIRNAVNITGLTNVMLAGGVTANRFVRASITEQLSPVASLYFPAPEYSPDNAVGAAFFSLAESKNTLFPTCC